MSYRRNSLADALFLATLATAVRLWAQVPYEWTAISTPPRVVAVVNAVAEFDDGSGAALYASGAMSVPDSSGAVARVLARFDGAQWVGVPCSFEGVANVLFVFDDGGGAALYLGGSFRSPGSSVADIGVLRFDGTTFLPVGGSFTGTVHSLCAFPPTNPELYAGGSFGVRRWAGGNWATVGSIAGTVYALVPFDTGSGLRLIAGGKFWQVGPIPGPPGWTIAHNVVQWTGQTWTAIGPGLTGVASGSGVYSLCAVETGPLQGLYAGGRFDHAGSASVVNIARFTNGVWSALGGGLTVAPTPYGDIGGVWAMRSFDDGSGEKIYAAGRIADAGGVAVRNIARWDGANWADVAGGVGSTIGDPTYFTGIVESMTSFDGDTKLLIGGFFNSMGPNGSPCRSTAALTSAGWTSLSGGISAELEMSVGGYAFYGLDLIPFEIDGRSELLALSKTFMNGYFGLNSGFSEIDGVTAAGLAKFDGVAWTTLSTGMPPRTSFPPRSITVWDDGSGEAYFAYVDGMMKWDGTTWIVVDAAPPNDEIARIFTFEAGGVRRLYGFSADGEILEWTNPGWTVVSTTTVPNVAISKIREVDLGQGPVIVICGQAANPAPEFPGACGFVVKWQGGPFFDYTIMGRDVYNEDFEVWGIVGSIDDVAAGDFGNGPELVVAGSLRDSGGAVDVRRHDGQSWHWVGDPLSTSASSLRHLSIFDDGRGAALTAVIEVQYFEVVICRFDGTQWSFEPIEALLGSSSVAVFDDGSGPDFVVAGRFIRPNDESLWTIGFTHSCLDGRVGASIGHPEKSLAIGPIGATTTGRSVDLDLFEPFSLSIGQPQTTPFPANFVLLGLFGSPTSSTVVSSPFGLSSMPLPGGPTPSFWITSNLIGVPQFFPSSPAPFSVNLPGLPEPFEVTIQGAILDASSPYGLSLTNGIVVRFGAR